MSDRHLRWGAIGASWIAQDFMIPAIRESGAEVTAVFSHDPQRATTYAARNGIPSPYSDLDAFLRDPSIDAVYISSTNQMHHDQVLAVAAAGKAILCEKPIATSLDEARSMVEACRRAGVVLAIDHHMRNGPTLRAMHRLLKDGAIGQPLAVRIEHVILLPDFLRTWRVSRPEAGGGAILDLTSHDADNVRFLLEDEVDDVVAIASGQRFASGGVEDAVMGVMRLQSGVVASFHDAFTIGTSPTGLQIHGTEGSLIGLEVLRQGPVGDVLLRRGDHEELMDVGPRDSLYVRGIAQFTDAVHGQGRPAVTGEDGARALAVALAVAEAASTGRRVTVPAVV